MNFLKSALGLPWLVCAARLVYKSRLYNASSTLPDRYTSKKPDLLSSLVSMNMSL